MFSSSLAEGTENQILCSSSFWSQMTHASRAVIRSCNEKGKHVSNLREHRGPGMIVEI